MSFSLQRKKTPAQATLSLAIKSKLDKWVIEWHKKEQCLAPVNELLMLKVKVRDNSSQTG